MTHEAPWSAYSGGKGHATPDFPGNFFARQWREHILSVLADFCWSLHPRLDDLCCLLGNQRHVRFPPGLLTKVCRTFSLPLLISWSGKPHDCDSKYRCCLSHVSFEFCCPGWLNRGSILQMIQIALWVHESEFSSSCPREFEEIHDCSANRIAFAHRSRTWLQSQWNFVTVIASN